MRGSLLRVLPLVHLGRGIWLFRREKEVVEHQVSLFNLCYTSSREWYR